MSPTPVILDVDPGHDDAVAIMLAYGAPLVSTLQPFKLSLVRISATLCAEEAEVLTSHPEGGVLISRLAKPKAPC